ncbi:phosphoribosylanthranilate isomerase [Thermoflexus sp.]|uniref:phosphoribosylanthranilate isomerase n=1 Tax=Thermoflexus sp. TaxID=1969742 RepID=UPI0026032F90|nr:phosphoribosylanthranilate isomerase [Thermoflexus sp.]MCX7691596.1 phosphoribosylanthranilate isomerase [Thermoflexus sp.]
MGGAERWGFVKICGITTLEDARIAVAAGADALGFVFYPKSPRFISPEQAAAIAAALRREAPWVRQVGVFVNEPVHRVREWMEAIGLDWAQLHGDEPPEAVAALADRAYKVLRLRPPASEGRLEDPPDPEPYRGQLPDGPTLGVDAWHPAAYGGTGWRADWEIAATWARIHRLLLGGGLSPENIVEAILRVRPWGVDVSSGVEREPGRKDAGKVQAFIARARQAFQSLRVGHRSDSISQGKT